MKYLFAGMAGVLLALGIHLDTVMTLPAATVAAFAALDEIVNYPT